MKKVAIVQSNYIPWRGYFDLIAFVDEFIIYDDMQYTKRDWRNRNRIKTSQGLQWITVPVQVKGRFHQKIRETLIDGPSILDDPGIRKREWITLVQRNDGKSRPSLEWCTCFANRHAYGVFQGTVTARFQPV